jgi:hypothetical protein
MLDLIQTTWERLRWALTPQHKKQARLQDMLETLEMWDEAAALLAAIREDGYTISFNSSLYPKNGYHVRASISSVHKKVWLTPFVPNSQLGPPMLHELRHYWQEKTLGKKICDLSEMCDRARDHVFVRRVLEADAQAFAMLGVYTFQKMGEGIKIFTTTIADLLKQNNTSVPTPEMLWEAQLKMNEHSQGDDAKARARQAMKEAFMENLKFYDEYDIKSLFLHHCDWIEQLHPVEKRPAPDFSALRGLLRAGTLDSDPSYLADMSDKELALAVVQHINPKNRRTMKLMDRFQAADAKGLLAERQKEALQTQICARIQIKR